MQRSRKPVVLGALTALFFAVVLIGCGGDVKSSSNTPTTPAPAPAPTPAPPPASGGSGSGGTGSSGSGGSGSGGSVYGDVQYRVQLMSSSGAGNDLGQGNLTVTTSGDVSIQVGSQAAGNSFAFQFCPYPASLYQCFDLGQTMVIGSGGTGQLTFHFPRSGTWAGYFRANGANSGTYLTTYDMNFGNSYPLPLFKMMDTNPSGACGTTCGGTQDPLTSGLLEIHEMALSIDVTGAAPNASYSVIGCGSGGSDCYSEGTVNSDASGNIKAGLTLGHTPAAILRLQRGSTPGFITGFHVP